MTTCNLFTQLVAEAYMRGARFALSDDATPLVIVPDGGLPSDLLNALIEHGDDVRGLVLAGIATALDGWQPTLTGLEHLDREQA